MLLRLLLLLFVLAFPTLVVSLDVVLLVAQFAARDARSPGEAARLLLHIKKSPRSVRWTWSWSWSGNALLLRLGRGAQPTTLSQAEQFPRMHLPT